MKFNLFVVILLLHTLAGHAWEMDSVRMESKGGQKFIIHRVEAGETLFAISQKYNVKIQELVKHNPNAEAGLSIHQEVLVPYFEPDSHLEQKFNGREIFHIVAPGETLYSLSRKYDVSIDSLKKYNKLTSSSLNLGDSLIVGYKTPGNTTTNVDTPDTAPIQSASDHPFHIVAASETLYSISKKYGISTEDLKKLNQLNSNELSIGQKLILSASEEEKDTPNPLISTDEEPLEETIIEEESEDTEEGKEEIEEEVPIDTLYVKTDNSRFKERKEKIGNLNKTIEEGFAMKIQRTGDTRRYLALHRTARIGTIIEVKNQMNNLSIFARVVGKLPETGINRNVLIRVSSAAYEKLAALDAKIPVEIGYVTDDD